MGKKTEINSLSVNLSQDELLEYSKALAKHTEFERKTDEKDQ